MSVVWRCPTTGLEEQFYADVHALLAASPYSWFVLSGYRSNEEQAILYQKYLAGGARAAPPGKSAHNVGKAVDVVLDADSDKPGLQPTWDAKLPGWLWLFAKVKLHPRLKSGWSFGDAPHIQTVDFGGKRYPKP